jgi:hypothetical protein
MPFDDEDLAHAYAGFHASLRWVNETAVVCDPQVFGGVIQTHEEGPGTVDLPRLTRSRSLR